jgi:PAS domain S-box-containing protein
MYKAARSDSNGEKMSKVSSSSAKNGGHKRQKSCNYLDEMTLCTALEMAKELVSVVNKVPATIFLWRPEKYWPADFVSENIKQFGYSVEEFTSGQLLYGNIVHPEDLERVERELTRKIEENCTDFSQEYRILTKSGDVRWVEERTFIEADETGVVKYLKGIILDITERKSKEKLLYIQRDLGIALSTSKSLSETLNILLDSCLQIDEIDAGSIALIDEETGDLNLAVHRGFSPTFVKHASHFSANSPNTKLVMIGQPVYKQLVDLILTSRDEPLRQEKLRATALIPVKSGNRVIAVFCLASRLRYELSDSVRTVIETIAMQFGVFISRISTEEKLKECIRSKNSK